MDRDRQARHLVDPIRHLAHLVAVVVAAALSLQQAA